jgi:hypothetical protein
MAVLLGSVKGNTIFGAFYYPKQSDKRDNNPSINDVSYTLLDINKKANERMSKGKHYAVEIKIYDNSKMKWKTIATKFKHNY